MGCVGLTVPGIAELTVWGCWGWGGGLWVEGRMDGGMDGL